jgi:hypothetical protein
MNPVNMKKTMKMNGKKTKRKVLANVETRMNQAIEANTKVNLKMTMNTMLQTEMRHCRSAGYPDDQIKAAGQEGIVESAWVPIVPLGGRPARDAMAPTCERKAGKGMR